MNKIIPRTKVVQIPPKLLNRWLEFYAALENAAAPFCRSPPGFSVDYLHHLVGAQEALDAALKSIDCETVQGHFILNSERVPVIGLTWFS